MVAGQVIPVSAIDDRLDKVFTDLSRANQQVRELELERDMLLRLRQSAVDPASLNGTDARVTVEASAVLERRQLRLPTAQAIYYVIKKQPGLRQFEVVNQAEPILDSASTDKRRLLFSAISNMKKKSRFRVDDEGRLYPKNGTGQEQVPLTD